MKILRFLALLVFGSFGPSLQAADVNYQDHIKSIFRDHCLKCHNSDEAEGDLDLSSYAKILKGGSSGIVVNAGRPEGSPLYQAVAHIEGASEMPPESPKLPEAKLTLIRDWIRTGLIEGKGGVSKLRSISEFVFGGKTGTDAPLPENLPEITLTKTNRPPIPQAIAASPGADLFVTSGQEQVLVYGKEEQKEGSEKETKYRFIGALPFPEGTIHDLKFSPNGSLILASGGRGSHSGSVVIFDVKTGERVREIGEEVDSILAADISADHKFVAFGNTSKIVKIYSLETGKLIHKIKKHTDWITSIAFSPDGKLLASGDRSGGIHIWETKNGAIVFGLNEHKVQVTGLSWRADGKFLASAAEDGNMILWDMKDGWPAMNAIAHKQNQESRYSRRTGVIDLDFSTAGKILTIGRDRKTSIWSTLGEQEKSFPELRALPTATAFLTNNQIVVGCFDGSIQIWDAKESSLFQSFTNGKE